MNKYLLLSTSILVSSYCSSEPGSEIELRLGVLDSEKDGEIVCWYVSIY